MATFVVHPDSDGQHPLVLFFMDVPGVRFESLGMVGFRGSAVGEHALPELLDALRSGDGIDLIRDAVRLVMQELVELEVTDHIGAARYERSENRTNERNGHRRGCWRPRPVTSN